MFEAFDRKGLAGYLDASERYIEYLDANREGPPRVKIAGKWRYPKSGVDNWIQARTETQCNAPGNLEAA
jgi:hypothetical protein